MSTLVIAEHDEQRVRASTRSAITAAAVSGDAIDVLVAGENISAVAEQIARLKGVRRVRVADDAAYARPLAENLAPLITGIAGEYQAIVSAATSFGKNLLPRVAALLDTDMVSEVTAIIDSTTFVRPIYAGHLNATVRNTAPLKIFTVRATAFEPAIEDEATAVIEPVAAGETSSLARWVSSEIQKSERPELSTARVVISGGRSLGSAEKFQQLLAPLANRLNAAIGATRAAVDAGIAPNEYQVGQTGTVVAPDLYIAVGVSGATQHIAGIKDSRVIVAINHDPDAQIFQWADYGLVADLFESVTELEKSLTH
ncbi:MAG: FAD-binding protein [Cellvibrio sp.]|jgi:electron transfer flavoprotein alpha subunit